MTGILKTVVLASRTLMLNGLRIFLHSGSSPLPLPADVRRVLIIAQSRLGDAVAAFPFLDAVGQGMSNAEIFLVANEYCAPLFAMNDHVDHIVTIKRTESLFALFRRTWSLRTNRFDLVIDLNTDYTLLPALIARIASPKVQIGYDVSGRGALFNYRLQPPKISAHIVDVLCALAECAGCPATGRVSKIGLHQKSEEALDLFLQDQMNSGGLSRLIGIHPGGHYQTQRWPAARFAELAKELQDMYHAAIVLFGDNREEVIIAEITRQPALRQPVLFVNRPIAETTAMLRRCMVFVGNNSGLLHLAGAVGVPTVSTMGPTNAKLWWPRGSRQVVLRKEISCIGCESGVCRIGTHDCMNLISVAEMASAVGEVLTAMSPYSRTPHTDARPL